MANNDEKWGRRDQHTPSVAYSQLFSHNRAYGGRSFEKNTIKWLSKNNLISRLNAIKISNLSTTVMFVSRHSVDLLYQFISLLFLHALIFVITSLISLHVELRPQRDPFIINMANFYRPDDLPDTQPSVSKDCWELFLVVAGSVPSTNCS